MQRLGTDGSTCSTSTASIPTCRSRRSRRRRRPGARRQGPASACPRRPRRRSGAPTRSSRSPRCRANIAVVARARGEICPRCRSSASVSCPTARSAAASSRASWMTAPASRAPTSARSLPRFTPEARKANRGRLDLVGRIAARKRTTPAQVALAWIFSAEASRSAPAGTGAASGSSSSGARRNGRPPSSGSCPPRAPHRRPASTLSCAAAPRRCRSGR